MNAWQKSRLDANEQLHQSQQQRELEEKILSYLRTNDGKTRAELRQALGRNVAEYEDRQLDKALQSLRKDKRIVANSANRWRLVSRVPCGRCNGTGWTSE